MKKIFFIAIAIFGMMGVKAQQIDTVARTTHYPNYFYYWWDDTNVNQIVFSDNSLWNRAIYYWVPSNGDSPQHSMCNELAQYQYTDTGLTIIGLAAVADPEILPDCRIADTSHAACTEYLRLYKPVANTLTLINEGTINPYITDTAFLYAIDQGAAATAYLPVYETYFNKNEYVTDSFYVAMTTGGMIWNEAGLHPYYPVWPICLRGTDDSAAGLIPHPVYPIFRHKYRTPDSSPNWIEYDRRYYYLFWPILQHDTVPETECPKVEGLSGTSDSANLTLTWTGSPSHSQWQVSVSRNPLNPEAGTIYNDSVNYLQLHFADTGCYYIRVRGNCTESYSWGDWSDSLVFCVSSGDITGIQSPSLLDRNTNVYPNPAVDAVTITSGYRITAVELYDLAGQRIVTKESSDGKSSLMAALSLQGIVKGTYILLVHTEQGTVAKRLVVQ